MRITRHHLAFFVAALFAIDLASRLLAAPLPAPRVFANYTIQRQADLIIETGDVDVVLMGTSLMGAGADPAILTPLLPGQPSVFNASVGGGGPLLLQHWARDLVIPELRPDVVVIGIGARDSNDSFAGAARTEIDYLQSKGRQRLTDELNLFGRADEWLERNVGVFQLRTAYREPITAAAFAINGSGNWRRATTDDGRIVFFDDASYAAPTDGPTTITSSDPLNNFAVGGRNFEAVGDAIEALTGEGIDVVLVDLPRVEQALIDVISMSGVQEYESAIASLAEQHQVRLLQGDEWVTDNVHFADRHHLNSSGTRLFSERLAEELTAEL